jgi:Tfp pilus assembly protein PilN
MVYAAALLFLILFFLLLKMRATWQTHEDNQDRRIKELQEETANLRERLQSLEAIEADLGPLETMRNRQKDKS